MANYKNLGTSIVIQYILAAAYRIVQEVHHTSTGYGNYLVIQHPGTPYVTLYAHCEKICVNVGDHVNQGDPIATVGSTGTSTGAHLHFEIKENGTQVDPLTFYYVSEYAVADAITGYRIGR